MNTIKSFFDNLGEALLIIIFAIFFFTGHILVGIVSYVWRALKRIKDIVKRVYNNLDESLRIKKTFSSYWLHILIFLGVAAIFFLCFTLEINYKKASGYSDLNFWLDNLVPNIIADMIGIILTTYIIAGLFSRNNKREEEKRLYKIVGFEYEKLINVLCRNYLYLLRRDMKYMSFLISDDEIKNEIENLSKEQRLITVSSTFIKPFKVMDISDGSYIFDNFVVMVPHIKNHLELMDLQYKKLNELSSNCALEMHYLDNIEEKFGKDSFQYKRKLTQYNQIKQELRHSTYVLTPIKKEHLHIDIVQAYYSLGEFFKAEAERFSAKYNTILPLDIRLIFSEVGNNVSIVSSNIYQYNNPDSYIRNTQKNIYTFRENRLSDVINHITIIAEQLLELQNYFNNTKRFM